MEEKQLQEFIDLVEDNFRKFQKVVNENLTEENKLIGCGILYTLNNQIAIMGIIKEMKIKKGV